MAVQQLAREPLDGVALPDQVPRLGDDEAEHGDGRSIRGDRQGDRALGRLVNVAEQACLANLAVGEVPGGCDKGPLAEGSDAGRYREALEEGEGPVAAGVVPEPLDFGEVERQVVGLQAMERLGLGLGHYLMGHRQLLNVVDPVHQRVVVRLGRPDPQHVQDDLGILGIVLVPAVVQRLPRPGQGN